MPQTKEDRICRHAKGLPRGIYPKEWINMNYHVWMPLARHWKMPIKAIKMIVKENASEEEARRTCKKL